MIEALTTTIKNIVLGIAVAIMSITAPAPQDNLGVALPDAVALFETTLNAPITDSATSMTLTAVSIRGGDTLTGYQCFTIDEGSAQAEYVCGTASGTVVSSLERGLSPSDGITEVASLKFSHRRGASVKVTNFPILQRLRSQNAGEGTFESAISYASGVTPVSGSDLADKEYVDSVVNGGTLSYDQIVINGNAGETFATGTVVYQNPADREWYKLDVDTTTHWADRDIGIAQGAGTDGNAISGGVLTYGLDANQTGLTAGTVYFASTTAGSLGFATTSQVIGRAHSATQIFVNPNAVSSVFVAPKSFANEAKEVGIIQMTAGATINGATLPVPVYASTTDNEVYAMSGSLTTRQKFIGFAVSNSTNGNSILIQTEGVVDGFTGLTEDAIYYVQNSAGSIGTATGTYAIPVGIALSETELLIKPGRRFDSGTYSVGSTVSNQTITLGFRPQKIRITGVWNDADGTAGDYADLFMSWDEDNTNAISRYEDVGTGAGVSTNARLQQSTTNYVTVGISGVNDTGFTIALTESGAFPGGGLLLWEAEGNY